MSKSHVAGWTSDSPTPDQLKEFFAQISSGRITKDGLQSFLRGGCDEFLVTVNRDQTLAEMIAAGHYEAWVNPNITADHFPVQGRSQTEVNLELVHLNKDMTSEKVIEALDRRGFRSADLPELLAFGAKYPDQQRQFPVVALGSVWRHPGGHRGVPCLYGNAGRRELYLDWLEDEWSARCRFLVARK